ncbi:MAG: hypothetical protein ACE367_05890 [Acidimicrobiales bacterium]
MTKKMMYGAIMLFMLFLITANPSGTGENGREFISWMSSGWDDAREFVSSLVGDETVERNELGEVPIPTVEVVE